MYILGHRVISPQHTLTEAFALGEEMVSYDSVFHAIEPVYSPMIPNALLRRMGKAVRMGIGCGLPLVQQFPNMDGIILGTANGGLEDCIKFLNQIVEYDEGVLTPTNFVQSTPNAVAGQLAIMSENRGYNMTHTSGTLAFESALTDAELFLSAPDSSENATLLVGGLDEISEYNFNIDKRNNLFKEEACSSVELLQSNTPGTLCGEGAAFFVLSNQATGACARIRSVRTSCFENPDLLTDFFSESIQELHLQGKKTLLLSGANGDIRIKPLYDRFANLFPEAEHTYYKHFCGEYRTASAFGLFVATELLNGKIPQIRAQKNPDKPDLILIFNTDGFKHSLIAVERIS